MKWPDDLERKVLAQITAEPDRCIFADENEPLIYPDGLTMRLSRYLWVRFRGELPREKFLLRRCDTFGCFNPYHRDAIEATRPPRERCPNNHEYDPATDLPGRLRCAVCAAARLERRRRTYDPLAGLRNADKTHCPRHHRLTGGNVYLWVDRLGRTHRKCRECTLERARLSRATA